MKIAYNLLPNRFEDGRHESFKKGLKRLGYDVIDGQPSRPEKGNIVLTWNAYGSSADATRRFIADGGDAIVFEEAYIRKIKGEKYFAAALGGHNGFGRWKVNGAERWDNWGIEVKPYRENGEYILVCGQRGFGYNVMAMPDTWPDDVAIRLKNLTNRPIHFRPHPKRRARMPKAYNYNKILDYSELIEKQLERAWAVVVYTSNAATNALLNGVPAFYEGPAIVTKRASNKNLIEINDPPLHLRKKAFIDLSWAQWSVEEFESGKAFEHIFS